MITDVKFDIITLDGTLDALDDTDNQSVDSYNTRCSKYIVPHMMIIATIITLTMIMIIIMMMMMIPDSHASSSSEEDFVSYNIPANLIIDMHGNRFTIDDNKKVIPVMMKMNALPSKPHKDKSMISLQDALLLVLSKNLLLAPRVNMMMRSSFLSISIVLYNPLHPVLMYTKNDDHDAYFY